jgi:hypothetical protein
VTAQGRVRARHEERKPQQRLPDVLERIHQTFHAPLLAGDLKQVADSCQFQPNGDRRSTCCQAVVPVLRKVGAAQVGQKVMRVWLAQPVADPLVVLGG